MCPVHFKPLTVTMWKCLHAFTQLESIMERSRFPLSKWLLCIRDRDVPTEKRGEGTNPATQPHPHNTQ